MGAASSSSPAFTRDKLRYMGIGRFGAKKNGQNGLKIQESSC